MSCAGRGGHPAPREFTAHGGMCDHRPHTGAGYTDLRGFWEVPKGCRDGCLQEVGDGADGFPRGLFDEAQDLPAIDLQMRQFMRWMDVSPVAGKVFEGLRTSTH